MAAKSAIPGSARAEYRSELYEISPEHGKSREDCCGDALERGVGLVRRWALLAMERHSEQLLDEMGRGDCEHLTRRVTRTEYDGSITVLAESYEGKRLNSPNDVVCKSDGSIWFTDPLFGILGNYEGQIATSELPTNVYRWDPMSKKLTVLAGDINRPNGLAFSPDESQLYVVEAGVTPRVIRAYTVSNGSQLVDGRTLITAEPNGTPDGLRVDIDGNLWVGWGMGAEGLDGVSVFNPQGKLIGRIDLPERCANLCFGGRHRNRLFMCGSTSVYSLFVNTHGAAF
jgi:gluconolactonase